MITFVNLTLGWKGTGVYYVLVVKIPNSIPQICMNLNMTYDILGGEALLSFISIFSAFDRLLNLYSV